MKTIAELLTNPVGFTWEMGEVSYEPKGQKGQKVSLGQAPHVKVNDVIPFETEFPGVILGSLNGTSIKVACQATTRRMLLKVKADGGVRPSDEAMRIAVLNALRGIKNRATVIERKVYTFNGVEYATLAEAQAAQIAFLIDLGIDSDIAREKVLGATA